MLRNAEDYIKIFKINLREEDKRRSRNFLKIIRVKIKITIIYFLILKIATGLLKLKFVDVTKPERI